MAKNLKYKLTEESILVGEKKLFRIQALKNLLNVKKGELGGFVESEENLSHYGNCWVCDNAYVFGNSRVYGNALIYENAQVSDNAQVSGNSWVFGEAKVYGDAKISFDAMVFGNTQIFGNAKVYGYAKVSFDAMIFGNAHVYGYAKVSDDAWIYGDAKVSGDARVYGDTQVSGGTWPTSPFCFCLSKHQISSCNYTHLKIGCLINTIDEWKERGEEIGKENGYSDTEIALYRDALELAEKYIELVKKETNNG